MPTSGVFDHHFRVPEEVIDRNGHVNNVAYVQWMQDVAVLHFRSRVAEELMQRLGCAWVARSHQIEYLRPALSGDEVVISTWIVN